MSSTTVIVIHYPYINYINERYRHSLTLNKHAINVSDRHSHPINKHLVNDCRHHSPLLYSTVAKAAIPIAMLTYVAYPPCLNRPSFTGRRADDDRFRAGFCFIQM